MVLFFNACFLLQKRSMIGFDESDEMLDLLAATLLGLLRMLGSPTWWRTLGSGPPILLVLELREGPGR